ncbi:MAG: DUF1573 domain-containing protein [Desulfobacula sp.]|uniref:DUF1573 domain-containing protein n=1 Tax=Desulfobacula sp. TaxID=2593537 RepID=UPI0025C188E7|nr:DUF1573 domain-containing protein [Desulfobacula sp.]MCD4719827.1 DUF1573 domain-containing protein [Desulfobacula sp.]
MMNRLIKSFLSCICFFVVFVVILSGNTVTAKTKFIKKSPLLVIEEPNINAGTVVEGFLIRHTFLLQNRGDAPLHITKVTTDCGCTKVKYDKIVEPDRNSYLRVAFNTAGEAGSQVKTIRIFSNDPLQPEIILDITAKVLKAVKVQPDRIFFNGLAGRELKQTVTICAPDNKPFSLKFKKSQLSDQVGFSIEKKKNNSWLVHIKNKAQKAETSRGRIFLTTDIKYRPLITIPVYSRIHDSLMVIPLKIDFGKLKKILYMATKTPNPVRSVNLKSSNKKAPKITSIDIDPKRFAAKIIYLKDMGITRIEISADVKNFEKGPCQAMLELSLDSPGQRTISVPVHLDIQ